MTFSLLAVGDLHLGARPSRLPDELTGRSAELGTTGVWRRIVDQALEQGVNAVVLAGDVVEDEDDFFEAYRELATGLERLIAADIRVLGVVGNHDVRVLPRLADQLAGFELLGRGGTWESVTLEAAGTQLTLHGWSFPSPHFRESPLQGANLERGPGINLGVLHADRDQPASPYAPVSSSELRDAGPDGWLLGHIHKPDALSVASPNGYLGSATGLDPGESGPRGPWLFDLDTGGIRSVTQWRIATMHWARLPVDLTGITTPEDARERLQVAVQELDESLAAHLVPPEAAALRVGFTGSTDLGAEVARLMDRESLSALHAGSGRIHYFVETLRYATRPVIDLAELARRADPAGLLAQRLQLLERGDDDPERQALIREARQQLREQAGRSHWQALPGQGISEAEVVDWLQRSGMAVLERLLAQGRAAS
ncbi:MULTISPECIES: metallophosphoesterase family protein [Halomonadaceae]|uniref:DNA repair exonuclease n=1 Tax=Vreelandella halophila TaxID=86177 RepID=A0A9X4YB72_9GAMM|nr:MULTISPECIES: metallophosphoesterase [Halomonas]MYL26692.1 DNA repair exonuclease [Halomonas utahensis]MYL75509.1 DNA repair exonuclease [Halomonas sp. 22501_18_FS]